MSENSPELAKTAASPASAQLAGAMTDGTGAKTLSGEGRRSTVLPQITMEGAKPAVSLARRDRFEELAPLGAGGMGEVVLLKDHDIERAVALKRLPLNADLGQVLRFVDEIRTVGSLEHPNIVPVHDVGIDDKGRYFFVMKHLKGDTLETIIERLKAGDPKTHERFTFSVRQQVFLAILNAVSYAHGQGVIHRDLKPANIMVGPFGEVTVMDWGLAKRLHASRPEGLGALAVEATSTVRDAFKTQAGAVMGTPMYMSPEQAKGAIDEVDERTDTYALSVILHELMFLRHYLDGRTTVPEIIEGVKSYRPSVFSMAKHPHQRMVPAEIAWFANRGLEKDRAQRFQSVAEMIGWLQRDLGGSVVVHCHRTMLKRSFQELSRAADSHPMLVTAAGVMVIGLFAAAVVKSLLMLF